MPSGKDTAKAICEVLMKNEDIDNHIRLQKIAMRNARALHQEAAAENLKELIELMEELKTLRELLDYLCDVIPPRKLQRYVLHYKRYNRRRK